MRPACPRRAGQCRDIPRRAGGTPTSRAPVHRRAATHGRCRAAAVTTRGREQRRLRSARDGVWHVKRSSQARDVDDDRSSSCIDAMAPAARSLGGDRPDRQTGGPPPGANRPSSDKRQARRSPCPSAENEVGKASLLLAAARPSYLMTQDIAGGVVTPTGRGDPSTALLRHRRPAGPEKPSTAPRARPRSSRPRICCPVSVQHAEATPPKQSTCTRARSSRITGDRVAVRDPRPTCETHWSSGHRMAAAWLQSTASGSTRLGAQVPRGPRGACIGVNVNGSADRPGQLARDRVDPAGPVQRPPR